MPGGFDAIVFDLDGVIVDSEVWWHDVRQAFAVEHGRTWSEADSRSVMGSNTGQWSAIMRRRLDLPVSEDEIREAIIGRLVERYRTAGPPTIPGAVETVRRLAGSFRLGLASGSHRRLIDAALETTGLTDAFRTTVSADEVARGKPEPDVYLEAARRLEVAPAHCLVVEDSLNGVLAGRRAGMTVVLVPNESVPPADEARTAASAVIDRLSDLEPASIRRARP